METIISDNVASLLKGFVSELEECGCLCKAKDFRYDQMVIPDYSDPFVQRLYLLRYFPAYLAEYYLMYRKLIRISKLTNPFSVLSIGSGSAIDYKGFDLALREKGMSASKYAYYTGIDRVEWLNVESLGNPDFRMVYKDIGSLKRFIAPSKAPFNVVIFPKSIGEFDKAGFEHLLDVFTKTTFEDSHMYILSSVRKQHVHIDCPRMGKLLDRMENDHGYKCSEKGTEYYYYETSQGLRSIIRAKGNYDWVYPQGAFDFLADLKQKCPTNTANGQYCHADCEESLSNKRPILKTDHIYYQVFELKTTAGA